MNSRHPRNTPKRVPAVPIHRGPQAGTAPLPSHGGQAPFHAPNAALLIDFDNVTTGIRSDLGNELRNLLASEIIRGKVAVQRAYADWRRYPQHMVPLAEASIDTIQATAYGSSKKNATDIRLAVDAVELVFTRPEIGTYILLSGDSDFSSLVIKLKEYGKYVIGVGIRESSSDLLVMNCDEYYSYNALTGLMKSGDEPSPKHDPWELVTESVARMKRNGDVMRSDRLKQVMQEIDDTFDEKDLGYSKFSRFCLEAATRGLLSVNKLENGQLEVDVPRVREAASPPEPEPRRAEPGGRGRGRRGGRGDRGERGDRAGRDQPADRGDRATPAEPAVDRPPVDVDYVANVAPAAEAAPEPARDGDRPGGPRARDDRDRGSAPQRVVADEIGAAGERLSRDEALGLVRRAVESLTSGPDDVARASDVRVRARELLGRDSETLAERHFGRILRDAHDSNMVDLRRRGDDFDIARAAEAAPVAEQLSRAEPPRPAAPSAPPAPRGMGPRGAGIRGRVSFGGRSAAPPADLLSIGVVDVTPETRSVASAAPVEPEPSFDALPQPVDEPPTTKKRPSGRTRAPARRGRATKKAAAAAETDAGESKAAAGKKPRRPPRRKSPPSDAQ